jgi:hypothetical protein
MGGAGCMYTGSFLGFGTNGCFGAAGTLTFVPLSGR